MQKDELIQLYSFLLQLKNYLEDTYNHQIELSLCSYENLNVTPNEIYKSKREHQLAIFSLSKNIADLLKYKDKPISQRIYDRLENLYNNLRDLYNFK